MSAVIRVNSAGLHDRHVADWKRHLEYRVVRDDVLSLLNGAGLPDYSQAYKIVEDYFDTVLYSLRP